MADAISLDIAGMDALEAQLMRLVEQAGGAETRIVWKFGGPAAPYALYVHEDEEAFHPRGGESGFLVKPLQESAPHLADRIARRMQQGMSLAEAARTEAEVEMTEMKRITPVEFGTLRDSGHVDQE